MKKTYISPDIKVIEAQTHNIILAGSPNEAMDVKGDYDSGSVTMGSRHDIFWDDEEEY